MPIYEYKCLACGQHSEFMQKMNDEPMKECPHCHKGELSRLISPVGFQLKGSGWYVTDFKDQKGKGKSSASGDKTIETKDNKSEDKKSETKTETSETSKETRKSDEKT